MSSWLGSSKKSNVTDEFEALRTEIASIARRVSGLTGATGDTLRDNVAQLRSNLPDSDSVSRAANNALDQGRQFLEHASGGVKEARVAVQQNPATSIAIAAGVGFLVGLIVGGSRHDD